MMINKIYEMLPVILVCKYKSTTRGKANVDMGHDEY